MQIQQMTPIYAFLHWHHFVSLTFINWHVRVPFQHPRWDWCIEVHARTHTHIHTPFSSLGSRFRHSPWLLGPPSPSSQSVILFSILCPLQAERTERHRSWACCWVKSSGWAAAKDKLRFTRASRSSCPPASGCTRERKAVYVYSFNLRDFLCLSLGRG